MDFTLMAQELRRDEGVRTKMYVDTVGKSTIGVGHNLSDKPVSDRAVSVMLDDDINDAVLDLDGSSASWWRMLSEVRQRVFVNMVFNLGIGGFLNFKKMLTATQAGDYVAAAAEMLNSKWASQVGARADRLAKMMETDAC